MNRYQRIVLVAGAVALVVAMWTTPRVQYGPQGTVARSDRWSSFANVMDLRTAFVRAIAVIGATGLMWFSLAGVSDER